MFKLAQWMTAMLVYAECIGCN